MQKPPGKIFVVGAYYVMLECASFFSVIGFDTTVMVRSIFLRGFNKGKVNLIAKPRRSHTKFIRELI